MRRRRLGKRERKTSYIWLRNTSRYSNEEAWPLIECAYDATERGLLSHERMPKIVVKLTNCSWMYRGRGSWTEWHGADTWKRVLVRIGRPGTFTKPITDVYPRFKEMPEFVINGHREAIVFVTAHEMQHALGTSGRKNGEMQCEHNGADAVEYYRKHKAEIDATIDARMQRKDESLQLAAHKAAANKDPNVRLTKEFEKATRRLEQWKRRMKAATNKVKKYQRAYNRLAKKIGASV